MSGTNLADALETAFGGPSGASPGGKTSVIDAGSDSVKKAPPAPERRTSLPRAAKPLEAKFAAAAPAAASGKRARAGDNSAKDKEAKEKAPKEKKKPGGQPGPRGSYKKKARVNVNINTVAPSPPAVSE